MFGNAHMERLFTLMPLEPQFRKPLECEYSFTRVGETRTVVFEDKTYGEVTKWHWDFGDGTTSDEQNPIHTYAKDGVHYVVTLYVEGPTGKAQCCKVWEVCVRDREHPTGNSYD